MSMVVIGCGQVKADHADRAEVFYTGSFFALCLKTAKRLAATDRIFILSGKHGLIGLDTILVPYDHKMEKDAAGMAWKVTLQAKRFGVEHESPVCLLSGNYVDVCRRVWPRATFPLAGLKGIGYMRRKLIQL
jgi:hypothetical protein